jgi:hypothetical protein
MFDPENDALISSRDIASAINASHSNVLDALDHFLGHRKGNPRPENGCGYMVSSSSGERPEYMFTDKEVLSSVMKSITKGSPRMASDWSRFVDGGGEKREPRQAAPNMNAGIKKKEVEVGQIDASQALSSKAGFVYVLTNDCMPGLVKVGMTTRSPSLRADELSSATGVPMPFVVAKYFEFPDAMGRERAFHSHHAGLRLPGREFFRMSADEAIDDLMNGEKPLSAGGVI